MNTFIKIITWISGVGFSLILQASGTTSIKDNAQVVKPHSLTLQIIQNQIILDNSMVKSATLVKPEKAFDYYGVDIKLKSQVVAKFAQITEAGIGKRMNFVLDGKVISSSLIMSKLGDNFLVTGLTRKEAKQFIASIR